MRPANPFSSFDSQVLDKKNFRPSMADIEDICRFFAIGKLKDFKKEHGVNFSHANIFIFLRTDCGAYAIKFYPADMAKAITIEYAVNRILIGHHFQTPVMYAGNRGMPFMASCGRLAACYSYINGRHLGTRIGQGSTVRQINTAMSSLNHILSLPAMGRVPFLKQARLETAILGITRASYALSPYDQSELIEASLKDAYRTFRLHQHLFKRRPVHNNITLPNMLVHQKTAYILDLTHVQEDYVLSDLGKLVISCALFQIPLTSVKAIVQDYFTRHHLGKDHIPVLNTLVKVGLAKEYMEGIEREKSINFSLYPKMLVKAYRSYRQTRQRPVITLLRKINDHPGWMA